MRPQRAALERYLTASNATDAQPAAARGTAVNFKTGRYRYRRDKDCCDDGGGDVARRKLRRLPLSAAAGCHVGISAGGTAVAKIARPDRCASVAGSRRGSSGSIFAEEHLCPFRARAWIELPSVTGAPEDCDDFVPGLADVVHTLCL